MQPGLRTTGLHYVLLFSGIWPIQFSSSDVSSFLSVLFRKEANASLSSLRPPPFFFHVFYFSWLKFDNFSAFHGNIFWWSFCFCEFVFLFPCFHFLVVSPIKPSSGSSLFRIFRRWGFFFFLGKRIPLKITLWTHSLCSCRRFFAQRTLCASVTILKFLIISKQKISHFWGKGGEVLQVRKTLLYDPQWKWTIFYNTRLPTAAREAICLLEKRLHCCVVAGLNLTPPPWKKNKSKKGHKRFHVAPFNCCRRGI